jgi:hypothetical protein
VNLVQETIEKFNFDVVNLFGKSVNPTVLSTLSGKLVEELLKEEYRAARPLFPAKNNDP